MSSSWTSRLKSWLGSNPGGGLMKPPSASLTPPPYQSWTRQQLVDRLTLLDSKTKSTTSTIQPVASQKPFHFDHYPHHRIALKVAYVGWRYLGFAAQKETQQTVEAHLFQSLLSSRLIQDVDSCEFTRCGRTDKGVSGLGQVVALNVRQSSTKLNDNNNDGDASSSSSPPTPTTMTTTTTIPYVDVLNHFLPDDIRILAWSPVSPTFNARFDCLSRTYKYMFLPHQLDIERMQDAAQRLVGTHDFRHFCKLDPSKQVNYSRTIHSIQIINNSNDDNNTFQQPYYEVVICGSAFLWHQVRCIMSILFLVGQRLEPPSIVDDLLNINDLEAKPDYPLASDLPLVLWDCQYPKGVLDWHYSNRPDRLQHHWDDLAYDQTVRAWLYQSFASSNNNNNSNTIQQQQQQQGDTKTVILGGGRTIRTAKYRPLLQRARADSEQVKRAKYHAKLERRRQKTESL